MCGFPDLMGWVQAAHTPCLSVSLAATARVSCWWPGGGTGAECVCVCVYVYVCVCEGVCVYTKSVDVLYTRCRSQKKLYIVS